MNKKILLKNAKIYNGTKDTAFMGDVLIEGDRIIDVAPSIAADTECEVTDLKGLSLAPGFIDAHSHNDWFALRENPLPYFSPFIRQGITTFVSGNCGLSAVGYEKDCPHKDKIGGGNMELDFSTGPAAAPVQTGNNAALAHAALQELGYSAAEINAALKGVDASASTEEMVRHALRAMVMKG